MDPNCDPNEPIVIPPDALGPIIGGNINVFYDNL